MSMLTSLSPSSHGVIGSFERLKLGLSGQGEYQGLAEERSTLAEELKRNGYTTGAFTAGITLDASIGFAQGFDLYDTSMYKLGPENTEKLASWVRENKDRPFFLFWHTFEVHAPYLNTRFIEGLVDAGAAAAITEEVGAMRAAVSHGRFDSPIGLPAENRRSVHQGFTELLSSRDAMNPDVCQAMYAGSIQAVDNWVGWLVDLLKELGIYEDTLIVLTSDHGEEFAERNPAAFYDSHGHTQFEELVHIPLILKLPGGAHGGASEERLACTIDIMPTILDVVSTHERPEEMQGTSLKPSWDGSGDRDATDRRCHLEGLAGPVEIKGIRTDRYKYLELVDARTVQSQGRSYLPPKPQTAQLLDLHDDPGERGSVFGDGMTAAQLRTANDFARDLRIWLNAKQSHTRTIELDPKTVEQLKSLGYIAE